MTSTISECHSNFLDHVHCSVCHLSLVASTDDTATMRSGEALMEDPFWIGECFHILCHREINGGQARENKPIPNEVRSYCPICSRTVYLVPLQLDQQLQAPAQRLLQPFEASLGEIMDIYRVSDLNKRVHDYLKGKVLEQKQLLDYVKQDLTRAWQLQRDLEETRKENLALRREIQALRSPPIKTEDGSASDSSAGHRDGRTTADREYTLPPSRPATLQQPRSVSQRPPFQVRPQLAGVHVQHQECDPQSFRPQTQTRPSTCGSDVFAFKPPPLSFRAIPPPTSATRSPGTAILAGSAQSTQAIRQDSAESSPASLFVWNTTLPADSPN
ncbi:uncharacterized protein SPSC_01458 [Sporisorium scitamineum]|uniref:Uncharacterized protein n=1 Tax=Sporisorium scitamineum TaxID=49012 RepID=A0A127Z9M6_9BASI|nr:uncharacterized protein SPSC_01458 [Sporisorium scitamineum]